LQENLELVADERRRELVKRLGAVAGLKHERAPGRNLAQRIAELPGFAREDERWQGCEAGAGSLRLVGVRPFGLMQRGV